MKILKMIPSIVNVSTVNSEQLAAEVLKKGGVIALPTDTVYGLACCASNSAAINQLYAIKSRNENKPVAVCVGRECDIQKWARVSHLPKGLLKALLPGPVTLILQCESVLDKSLMFNGKVGVRIPDNNFIREVANRLDCPVVLTSANVSSKPSTVNVDEFSELWSKLDGIFDGGNLNDSNRGGSTVIDLSEVGLYNVVRKGVALKHTTGQCESYGLLLKVPEYC